MAAECAVRIAPVLTSDDGIPPIIGLSYPLYPMHQPELGDPRIFGAILGEALFCQGDKSNRGDYKRLDNSMIMMANHVKVRKIRGADHNLKVSGQSSDKVAYWIANDIENFFRELR